mgnify:FL=1
MILIDKNSKKPLYLQIYEEIFNQIQNEELATGDVLIPTRVLAKELGVSRNTVDQAYSQLVLEGLVVSKRGSGYIVSPTNDYSNNDNISTPFDCNFFCFHSYKRNNKSSVRRNHY